MFVTLFSVLTLLAFDEQHQNHTPNAPQTAEQTEADRVRAEREARDNEQVCRREHVVGSNRPQRVCMTRREWEEVRQNSRDMVDRANREQGVVLEGTTGGN